MFKLALMFIAIVFAHGEDAPGPHGGHIVMPANFHTELVLDKNGTSFQVYLLDIQFKNPITKKSEVKARYIEKKKITAIKCSAMDHHFMCESAVKMKTGFLKIKATRDGVEAPTEAAYELPLKVFKTAPVKADDHSVHH
jgi:hypothetical protein